MYKIKSDKTDPKFSMALPEDLIRDLVHRSQENGREINTEVAIRLARSLDADTEQPNDGTIIKALNNSRNKPKKR